MRRRLWTAACALAAAAVLAGCSTAEGTDASTPSPSNATYPMTISNCGREVTIDKPPERIFAERDTSTTIAAAGGADRIIARSGEGDLPLGRYRDALKDVPQVTKDSGDPPPAEVVLEKDPDLVVAGHVTAQDVHALEELGIPVIVPDWFCQQVTGSSEAVTFDDTYDTIEQLGKVLHTEKDAKNAVDDLRNRVAAVRERLNNKPERSAANLYISPSLLQAYGSQSVNDEVMRTLGLSNVFSGLNKRNAEISTEPIVNKDPDVVILSFGTAFGTENAEQAKREYLSHTELADTRAVESDEVFALNYGYLTGGPLTVDGLETLAEHLDPDGHSSNEATSDHREDAL